MAFIIREKAIGVLRAVHFVIVEVIQNSRIKQFIIVLESAFRSFFLILMEFTMFHLIL